MQAAIEAGVDGLTALRSRPLDLDAVRLLAPVPRPGKVICIGLNYRDHAEEAGLPVPERPVVFTKHATAVVGPEEPIRIPRASNQIDYEAELAVIIGKRARNVSSEEAERFVFGYTNFNDISARDLQFSDSSGGQWTYSKSFDTFAPMGPYLVTGDEIGRADDLTVRCLVNGHVVQESTTAQMVFPIPELISFLSQDMTLEPGDVIATGTPAGVGMGRKPPLWLQAGDRVIVEISGIGALGNPVAPAEALV